MSAPDSTVVQFNLKVGNDLINLYATSVAEGEQLLDLVLASGIPQKYHDTVAHLSAVNAVASTPAPTPAPAPAPAPVAASAPAPVPGPVAAVAATATEAPVPMCDHGLPARHVPGGISKKTNRPYPAFYACAQPRDAQCNFRANAE
jgi:hypothetical protein